MALSVNRKELDEFCPQLFRTLDGLRLLPLYLGAKPNEFEKYPRLLFGSIQRRNDVEAGFKEWESRVLRDASYRKEEYYPALERLRQWMVQHKNVFAHKPNIQHLQTSLYARVFQYLYPRRVLANAYCVRHVGNLDAITPQFLVQAFPESIASNVQKLKETYSDDWSTIVVDTQASLVANAAYYREVLRGKYSVPSEQVEQNDTSAPEEELS